MSDYRAALDAANKAGAANATDEGVMAQFCDSVLQTLVGAASPELVWNGARQKGMSARDLNTLALKDPAAVHDLMWV